MRHTNFKIINENFSVINVDNNSPLVIYKFIFGVGATQIFENSITQINNHYIADITTPAEDCFLLITWGSVVEIIRVGAPDILLMVHTTPAKVVSFTQYSLGGSVIGAGVLTEIINGFYYGVPYSYVDSFFEIESSALITMKLPYNIGEPVLPPPDSGAGSLSDMVYLDTPYRYATFAFTGDRYSYFDLQAGKWMSSPAPATGEIRYTCKASDLMYAFCSYYGISYDRTAAVNITQYISTVRVFDENTGFFRGFQPGITPETNVNNFDVIYDDEFGNTVYQGLQILFVGVPLTTEPNAAGPGGIIIPFTNKAFENRYIT